MTKKTETDAALLRCQQKRSIEEILASLDGDKKLALFGAGTIGRQCLEKLRSRGCDVHYFADNDPAKIGTDVLGVPVISAESLAALRDKVEILVSSTYTQDIITRLGILGLASSVRGDLWNWFRRDYLAGRSRTLRLGGDGRVVMPQLVAYLLGKCNLRCEHCVTFSPFRRDMDSPEDITASFESWERKLRPGEVHLSGGEILLHPSYEEIVRNAAGIWKRSRLLLYTNGILLDKVSDSFLAFLAEGQHTIVISRHLKTPVYRHLLDMALQRLATFDVSVTINASDSQWWQYHATDGNGIPVPADSEPERAWENCTSKVNCCSIQGRKIFKCAVVYHIQKGIESGFLSKSRWKDAAEHRGIDFERTPQEILDYLLSGPMKACRVCPESYNFTPPRQLSNEDVCRMKNLANDA